MVFNSPRLGEVGHESDEVLRQLRPDFALQGRGGGEAWVWQPVQARAEQQAYDVPGQLHLCQSIKNVH